MKEEENINYGKLYFIEVGMNEDKNNCFGSFLK